jgi:hypothetical protein
MQGRAIIMSKPVYLTFPIIILKDGLTDIKKCVSDAMKYCLYYQFHLNCERHISNPLKNASNHLGIIYHDTDESLNDGSMLYDSINDNAPKTSISKEMLFDFLKNNKSEFEIVCFIAFASLKSIIQKQVYKKITNEYLLNRMSGNSKSGAPINPLLKKYSNRYQLDKIKTELQLNWGLKYYAVKTRGFYASFTMPLNELALIAERKNRSYKLKLLKEKIKEASRQAKEQVMKEKLPVIISNELDNNST